MRTWGILLVMLCLVLAGCSISSRPGPSQEDMDRADFGPPPRDIDKTILAWMDEHLYDPISAIMEILSPPEKSWWGNTGTLMVPREIHYCWIVKTRIIAKNKMGGYIGWKSYHFYIRDGKIEYYQIIT